MNQSPTIAKLASALSKAQGEMRHAQKSGDNKFDKYRYSKLEDFFDASKKTLASNGLAISISTLSVNNLEDRITKNGGAEHVCQVQVCATLIHESGEWIESIGFGEGQDRADKAIYKAITGARKYVLAGLLAIPTTDDPEADEQVGTAAPVVVVKKVDSKGNEVTKKPTWSADQQKEVGAIRADILAEFGDMGDKQLAIVRQRVAYDQPHDAIDAVATLLNELRETKNQGNK
jgi:hypothetical protein